jgi:hypothetical protein
LTDSIVRTGNKPVYPVIVIPIPDQDERYWIISGVSRVDSLFLLGIEEVEVIVHDVIDELEVKNMIIDLNKQRVKSGREQLMEFRHYLEMYPEKRGIPGNRYSKIGKEMGRSKDRIKDFVMLDNYFHGDGDVVLENIIGSELSVSQGFKLKEVVEKYTDKFTSEESFKKFCNRSFDFKRLDYSLSSLDPNDETEFELIKKYLLKELTPEEFHEFTGENGKG